MARAKVTYTYNPDTGKREWHIHYESRPNAMLHEHEKGHRELVRALVGELDTDDVEVARGEAKEDDSDDKKAKPTAEEPLGRAERKPN
jgi:hypothetical protein